MGISGKFFYHDIFARHDPKLYEVFHKLEHKGYACFFLLLEVLGGMDNCQLNINEESTLSYLQSQLFLKSRKEVLEVIYILVEAKLIVNENGIICSPGLLRHMKGVKELTEKRRDAVSKRWDKKETKETIQEETPVLAPNNESQERDFKTHPEAIQALDTFNDSLYLYNNKKQSFEQLSNIMEKNAYLAFRSLFTTPIFSAVDKDNIKPFILQLFKNDNENKKQNGFVISDAWNNLIRELKDTDIKIVTDYMNAFDYIHCGTDTGINENELQRLERVVYCD